MKKILLLTIAVVLQGCGGGSGGSSSTIFYAYNSANDYLVSFKASDPSTFLNEVAISGLSVGEKIKSMDFRPADGLLYAYVTNGTTARIAIVNTVSGALSTVGSTMASMTGSFFGLSFNAVVDRIRVISDDDENLRFSPTSGALVATDTSLSPAGAIPVGLAYTNNFVSAALSTAYVIDAATDSLLMLGGVNGTPSANGGALTTVGSLGVLANSEGGFEIVGIDNVAYAALSVSGASRLYTIDLTTGAATLIGAIGIGTTIDALAAE